MNFKEVAVAAARGGGKIVRENFGLNIAAEAKGAHDVVSKVDYASEKMVIETIKAHFPEHKIVAEESGASSSDSDYAWYIDPLDGTLNFLLGIPYFSVSIGLAYKNEMQVGVVYNPILDEMYSAEKGKGAFLNGVPISVSKQNDMRAAFIASAYSSAEDDIKRGLQTIERLALASRKVVINFSPALDLCNIARGKLDALVDNGTTPEDHAAGSIILLEAGGVVKNYKKASWDVRDTGIIASNGLLQEAAEELAL